MSIICDRNIIYFSTSEIVWILTRQREPSAETIDAAKKILTDNDISQAFLSNTIQKKCPQLDGNNTGLSVDDELDVDDFVTTVVPNAIEKAWEWLRRFYERLYDIFMNFLSY